MIKEAYIDKTFRKRAEKILGKAYMDSISSEKLEEARCIMFNDLAKFTSVFGKLSKETVNCLIIESIEAVM